MGVLASVLKSKGLVYLLEIKILTLNSDYEQP